MRATGSGVSSRSWKRFGLATLAAATAATLAVTIGLQSGAASDKGGVARYDDGIADYGVCRGTDPSCYNDWDTVFRNDGQRRVLVYTATGTSRHAHLGPLLGPGMNPPLTAAHVAQSAVVQWGQEYGFSVDWTEDVTQLNSPARLRSYDAVIFLSNSRTILDDAAQTALMQYIRSGGGFVGIHNTLGAMYHWPWFQGLLGGTHFYDHGPHQEGEVVVLNKKDESTKTLPRSFNFKDEWYNLEPFPSHVRFLAAVEEKTMLRGTKGSNGHPGHGKFHPVSWCQYYDGGRSWVTSLGHDSAAWNDTPLAGDTFFKEHVVNGILSTMGAKPFCR
ncbi:ThuA domain-containing protein [Phytohabitans kaempferiae]|uniref:ThuA domain-containing protein n=1 Tax=Phytohabitans kaempferiae TaxID=1620943 RepID=A0ABV6M3D6_9ACTN